MQSSALALFSSSKFLKLPNANVITRLSSSKRPVSIALKREVFCRSNLPFSYDYGFRDNSSRRPFVSRTEVKHNRDLKARAAADSGRRDGEEKSRGFSRTWQLGILFGIWYTLNIYFNIFNKQVLKVYPFSATLTAFQFGCGTVLVLLMWTFNLHPKPKIRSSQLAVIVPLALLHTMGNLLTNISLGRVAVSFTHTIKSMEPFFTVLLSFLFLGERPTLWVVSSLVPIVGGVALASFTEASFNWLGFCSAMASNMTNQFRNVMSKKFMVNKEEALDNVNLFSVITMISFVLLVPAAIFMEGIRFTPSYLQSVV